MAAAARPIKSRTQMQPPALLKMQMVPWSLHRRNLRTIMSQAQWRAVREALLTLQGLTCGECGKAVHESKRLHAHEEWTYLERADPAVAWLHGIKLVCFHCHAVEHPGFLRSAIANGELTDRALTDTIAHFCAVNGVTKRQWGTQLRSAEKDFVRRSGYEWYIDYGPFAPWLVATFDSDPLNGVSWPEEMAKRWGTAPASLDDIVGRLFAEKGRGLPASRHGLLASLFEEVATEKAEARRRKAAKRKRDKIKATKSATARLPMITAETNSVAADRGNDRPVF